MRTHPPNGNVLNDNLHTFSWDVYGRPITIASVGVTYDAMGRAVEQNRSGVYKSLVYAPTGEKLALVAGQGTVQWAFVPLPGSGRAIYLNGALGFYRHADWLGSDRLDSTPTRTIRMSEAYAPFGEPYTSSGSTDVAFTGQNQDTLAGLDDFPAREYSYQGRWASPDPAGLAAVDLSNPQSWNRYAYVRNNPLAWIDPLGLNECAPGEHDCNAGIDEANPGEDILGAACCIDLNSVLEPIVTTAIFDTLGAGNLTFVSVLNPLTPSFAPDTLNLGDMVNGSWGPSNGGGNSSGDEFSALQYQQYQGMRLLQGLTPTVCGGGGFAFLGAQAKKGSAQGFAGGILEWDSKSGWSGHGLFEFGSHGAGGGVITNPLEGLVFLPVGEFSVRGVPVEVGALATTSGAVGAYGEVGRGPVGVGAGGYVNIGSALSCGPS